MQKSSFVADCNIIRLYYENAEASIINDLYYETSDDSGSTFGDKIAEFGKKIVEKIDQIIQAIKDFFAQIQRKHESAKIQHMLKSECAHSMKMLKVNIKDKEVMKIVSAIFKMSQKAFAEIRKVYDQFMSHKIDYDTYCQKIEKITDDYDRALQRFEDDHEDTKIIDSNTASGAYKLSELTKRVSAVEVAYTKVLSQMRDDVIKEENRIKAAARSTVVDNATSSATAKTSSILSKINKKAVAAIISVVGIVSAASFCYKHGKSNSGKVTTESADEDYFSDILRERDSFMEESAYDEDRNIFEEFLY